MHATVVHMTTETSPRPLQGERRSPARGRRSDGLEPVLFLHDADGNLLLPPFPMFEVRRSEATAARQLAPHPDRPGPELWAWVVGCLLAPFAVLVGALSLPASDPVRGAALAAGWALVGAVARWLETRRRRHPR